MRKISHLSFAFMLGLMITGCDPGKPALVLTYSPKDAVVTIDGFEPAEYSSPHTFEFYKPGSYRLDVRADGYMPLSMMVMVMDGTTVTQSAHLVKQDENDGPAIAVGPTEPPEREDGTEPPTPEQKVVTTPSPSPKMFVVAVESVPPGAEVSCSRPGSSTRTEYGPAPLDLELEATGAWEVTLELDGYKTARRVVVVPASADKVILTQILSKLESGQDKPLEIDTGVEPPPPPPPPPLEVTGRLFVVTDPSTRVSVDGKPIGSTPIEGYPVPVGTHKILMENRELGKRKVRLIEVEPGSDVRLAEEL